MKKNVVTAIIAGVVLVALCVGAFFANEKNKDRAKALREGEERLEKMREITNQSDGFDLSTLPDDSPLKVDKAEYSAE